MRCLRASSVLSWMQRAKVVESKRLQDLQCDRCTSGDVHNSHSVWRVHICTCSRLAASCRSSSISWRSQPADASPLPTPCQAVTLYVGIEPHTTGVFHPKSPVHHPALRNSLTGQCPCQLSWALARAAAVSAHTGTGVREVASRVTNLDHSMICPCTTNQRYNVCRAAATIYKQLTPNVLQHHVGRLSTWRLLP
jgi:hypothetical protein